MTITGVRRIVVLKQKVRELVGKSSDAADCPLFVSQARSPTVSNLSILRERRGQGLTNHAPEVSKVPQHVADWDAGFASAGASKGHSVSSE